MSLRIVWGGPWNSSSDVAEIGAAAVDALVARGHAVEVLRTEVAEAALLPSRPANIPVRFWNDVDVYQLARQVDIVIANFGDSYALHGALLANIGLIGAVGIMHGPVLAHLAADWACSSPFAEATLRRVVSATYGPQAWTWREPFLADQHTLVRKRSMIEWFVSGLCCAVVESLEAAERVRSFCPGPVRVIQAPKHADAVAYADELLTVIDEALVSRPAILAAQALGRSLSHAVGIAPGDPAVDRVGMTLHDLLGT